MKSLKSILVNESSESQSLAKEFVEIILNSDEDDLSREVYNFVNEIVDGLEHKSQLLEKVLEHFKGAIEQNMK